MWSKKHRISGHAHRLAIVLTAISIAIAGLLLLNRQFVIDQVTVWQYKPGSAVAALADRSQMNDHGKFYFYASQPSLEEATSFNQKCTRKEHSVAILGCYTGRYIYIYNVTDEKLEGIREVTAAHEMLHAAYDRLSDGDKTRINKLLDSEYEKLKNDEKLAERMAFYARTEPGERENELHSVIGTEVDSISSELEAYYERYFSDRHQIVQLHHKYESVFNQLQTRAEDLIAELTALGDAIEDDSTTYNKEVIQLNQDIQDFNRRAENGGFVSYQEFTSTRSSLVSRADQLDAMRGSINAKVMRYEALRSQLEQVASQSDALNRSIDSTLAPAPSI